MVIERALFEAADKMRGSMDLGEYKHVALGLLFLRCVGVSPCFMAGGLRIREAQEVIEEFV